jgi:spermidine synthase
VVIAVMEDDRMNQILFVCKGDSLQTSSEDLLRRSAQLSKSHEIHLLERHRIFYYKEI